MKFDASDIEEMSTFHRFNAVKVANAVLNRALLKTRR